MHNYYYTQIVTQLILHFAQVYDLHTCNIIRIHLYNRKKDFQTHLTQRKMSLRAYLYLEAKLIPSNTLYRETERAIQQQKKKIFLEFYLAKKRILDVNDIVNN